MAHSSDARVQKIQAAVLRKRGGPLKIESLELEGPQDDEILVRTTTTFVTTNESARVYVCTMVYTHNSCSTYLSWIILAGQDPEVLPSSTKSSQ